MRCMLAFCLFGALGLWAAGESAGEPVEKKMFDYAIPLVDEEGFLVWSGRTDAELRRQLWLEEESDRRGEIVLAAAVRAALEGPDSAEGARALTRALPDGLIVNEVRVRGEQGGFFITLPPAYLRTLDDERAQFLSDLFLGLSRAVPTITRHVLMVRDPADGFHHPLDHFLPRPVPVPPKESELETTDPGRAAGQPPAGGQGQPAGFLSGKSVFVNPGHGWYYNTTLGRWATQRGNTYNLIEDLSNAEAVFTYLTHYLWNAGAGVYSCRERDLNPAMVIVDNGGTGYAETGTWTTIAHTSAYGGTYRRALVGSTETATATFTPTVPAAGFYHVYLWYRGTAENATDVRISIRHTGGTTVVTLNQERDGDTWKDLGRYHFNGGYNPESGAVILSNQSGEAGNYVAADAVRLGGGTGEQQPFGEPFASGWPRFEEAGPYHAAFMGCPSATCGSSTVNAMPKYAAWENESWEDSVYLSWHSNAYDGTGRGTSSFAYASGGWDSPFNGVAGGLELRDAIHAEIIADLRAGYDPAWPDQGLHTNWYGELNPANNPEMPAALFEMAYHDNPTDAAHLRNPVFRQMVARAVYQGVVKYFAARDGVAYTLLPEPPVNLRVHNDGAGRVVVAWDAPPYSGHTGLYGDAAAGYKVYRSTHGLGFDDGTVVAGTAYTDASVAPGTVYYYRVTALNAGGESFPTETLAVRIGTGPAPVLIVSGFDRMDQNLALVTDDPYSTSDLHRGFVDRMNSYRYMLRHAASLSSAGYAFDSASNEAVRDGDVALGGYCAVDWFLGEESTADHTFDPTEQAVVQAYLAGGGALFVSGAEIGWDLDYKGNGAAFYNGYLMADYLSDDAGTHAVSASAGGIFDGLATFAFDDASEGEYDTEYPDRISPLGGALACLAYSGGLGGTAGIQFQGTHRVVNLGFPFEMITASAVRDAVMDRVMNFLVAGCAADQTAPDSVGDSLRWNGALGRWEWAGVERDRFGGPETVQNYRVRRSADPAVEGRVVGEPSEENWPDPAVPPFGCWFYQVTAVDAAGNEGEPFRYALRDNPHAVFTGTWSTGTTAPGHYGEDYRYAATGGNGFTTAVWSYFCRETGNHDIAIFYPQGWNRSAEARFTVTHAGGSALYTVNQQIDGGTWRILGNHFLQAGQTYTVTLDDAEPAGYVVIADAVRWVK